MDKHQPLYLLFISLIMTTLLCGCGAKGALFLPEDEVVAEQPLITPTVSASAEIDPKEIAPTEKQK